MESSFFSSKKPHFFKVLTEDVMSFEKLPLPPAFVLKHGRSLSNSVSLRIPNGMVWPVRLLKQDGNDICFHTGWRKFAKFYSICYGYLIAFELEESNKFTVLIFDRTTREINYLHNSSEEPEHSNDASDELSDELTTSLRSRKNSNSQYPCSSKKLGANSTSKTKCKKTPIQSFKRNESGTASDIRITRSGSASRGKMESVAKPKASQRAKSNGTSNPHFKAKVSTLDQTTTKIISSRGSKEPTQQATKDPSVQPLILWKKTRKGYYSAQFRELEPKKIPRDDPLKAKKKPKALMAANEFISDNPHFKVVIRQSYLNHNLLMKSQFADKYIKDTISKAILSVDGKKTTWSVEVHKYYNQSAGCTITKISHAWPKFVRANKLKIGDVCVFELTNISKVKFKVSIFRAGSSRKSVVRVPPHGSVSKGKNMAKPKASERANGNGASIKTEGEEAEADLTTPRFKSVAKKHQSALTNAHFQVPIQTSYISRRQVQIPAQFAKTYLHGINHCNVTLCLSGSNGKSWSAEYHREGTGEQEKRILYHGWHKFFCDNQLNLGDVCRFEWMDAAEVKLKVSISRAHSDHQGVLCKLES